MIYNNTVLLKILLHDYSIACSCDLQTLEETLKEVI